ncbi:MAG: GMC family oxidoreductase [Candidatus Sedimenticola sp. 1PA]
MFIDATQLAEDHSVDTDICIIGAGVAGITIAQHLGDTSHRITVIESGGLEYDRDVQDLYAGEYLGRDTFDLRTSRLRFFGGTSNHWAGNCQTLDPIDFEQRPWMPHSGWPITYGELLPFYKTAAEICDLPGPHFDAEYWARLLNFPTTPLSSEKMLHEVLVKSPPTRFGQKYKEALNISDKVTVYLNCNLTSLNTHPSGKTVKTAEAMTLDGKKVTVRSKVLVIACGGIENARLLLHFATRNKAGFEKVADNIGRYYMDHPVAQGGILLTAQAAELGFFNAHAYKSGLPGIRGSARISPRMQKQHEIGNTSFIVSPTGPHHSWAKKSLRAIYRSLKHGHVHDLLGHQLKEAMSGATDDIRAMFSDEDEAYTPYMLTLRPEHAPNPESRVTLTEEKDALGINKVKVDWRLTEFDKRSMEESLKIFAAEAGRLGWGRVKNLLGDDPAWADNMRGGPHHMGTTRMHESPGEGVVDSNCRVHGIDNLYLAGSSVFPTSSCAMPTLTITALAVRLADHLKEELKA